MGFISLPVVSDYKTNKLETLCRISTFYDIQIAISVRKRLQDTVVSQKRNRSVAVGGTTHISLTKVPNIFHVPSPPPSHLGFTCPADLALTA
jgi:hypothetical protein